MKVLIFDSGTLINLSMNGLLYILTDLKKQFKGKFIIPHQVRQEVVDRPINIDRFELGALRIQNLIETGVLELPESIKIDKETVDKEAKIVMDKANHYLQAAGQWIAIVSEAEMACLAVSDECLRLGYEPLIAIDERTTRLLGEKPENLEKLMSDRLHQQVKLVAQDFRVFNNYRFIRSSELIYVAYKKNVLHLKGPKVLEAALYATKFKGSAISFEEIEQLKKLG